MWKNSAGKGEKFRARCYCATMISIESYEMGVRAWYEDVINNATDKQHDLLGNEQD